MRRAKSNRLKIMLAVSLAAALLLPAAVHDSLRTERQNRK